MESFGTPCTPLKPRGNAMFRDIPHSTSYDRRFLYKSVNGYFNSSALKMITILLSVYASLLIILSQRIASLAPYKETSTFINSKSY